MSAEVVKKRGRPKKVVPEIAVVELPENVKKAPTRAKSTKAATTKPVRETTKTVKATTAKSTTTSAKPTAKSTTKSSPALLKVKATEGVKQEASSFVAPPKPAAVNAGTISKTFPPQQSLSKTPSPIVKIELESQPGTVTKSSAKPVSEVHTKPGVIIERIALEPGSQPITSTKPTTTHIPSPLANNTSQPPLEATEVQSQAQPPPTPATTVLGSPVTPATSKILSRVRELSQKSTEFPQKPAVPSIQQTAISASHTSAAAIPKLAIPSASPAKLSTSPSTLKTNLQMPPPSQSKPDPKFAPKKIPVVGFNKEIVSNITARAGARPNPTGRGGLPPNYKATARKVTFAIVAAPIAIVTSYVLYQRLILGEDQKHLVNPGSTAVVTAESQAISSTNGSKST